MARRRKRRGQPEIGKWIGGAVLLLLCFGVIGGFAYLKYSTPAPVTVDRETLCPVTGPKGFTLVLLDASDDLPAVTRTQIRTILEDAARALPKYELLELRILDPSAAGGRLLFSRCNPGDGSDLSTFVANPEKARQRWLGDFDKPLAHALEEFQSSPAETSPIAETLQRIAVEHFDGARSEDAPKRLIVISDMIEHGSGYSQYRDDLSYESFRRLPAYKRLRTDLHGASVEIYYVQRLKPSLDSGAHIRFWTDWISDNNGRLDKAVKLQGAG